MASIRKSAAELIAALTEAGWHFSDSCMESTGKWTSSDADWNYRDIPHLNFVHSQVDGILAYASDDALTALFLQKIGPFKVLLPVSLHCSRIEGQVYHTSFANIVLVIETTWSDLDDGQGCRVVTRYHVGTGRIFRLVRPLIHKVLARNYRILMTEDLPMREERAKLRARGFSFSQDSAGHSYVNSLRVAVDNVRFPDGDSTVEVSTKMVKAGRTEIWNSENTRGVVVVKDDHNISVYPATCSHEGAALITAQCDREKRLICPWHGKRISSLWSVELDQTQQDCAWRVDVDSKTVRQIK